MSLLPNLLGFVVPTIMASCIILRYTLFLIGDWRRSKKHKVPKWAQGIINGDVPYFYRFSKTFGCVQRGEHYKLLHWCPKSEGFRYEKSFKQMNEFPNNYCTSCEIQIPSKEKLLVMIKLQDLTSGPTEYLYAYPSDID